MRKILYVSVLVLALCGSAYAGDIPSPPLVSGDIPTQPSAPQPSSTQAEGGITQTDDTDGLAAAALSILDNLLALF